MSDISSQVDTVSGVTVVQRSTNGAAHVQVVGSSTGGNSFYAALTTATKAEIKAAAATLYTMNFLNVEAAITHIQLYNKLATNVTVGTTGADLIISLPASAAVTVNFAGVAFGTGLTIASTTTRTGSTTAGAHANIEYK